MDFDDLAVETIDHPTLSTKSIDNQENENLNCLQLLCVAQKSAFECESKGSLVVGEGLNVILSVSIVALSDCGTDMQKRSNFIDVGACSPQSSVNKKRRVAQPSDFSIGLSGEMSSVGFTDEMNGSSQQPSQSSIVGNCFEIGRSQPSSSHHVEEQFKVGYRFDGTACFYPVRSDWKKKVRWNGVDLPLQVN